MVMAWYIIIGLLVIAVAIAVHVKRKSVKKVPQGIQVFNSLGQTTVDLSSRLTRIIGVLDISWFDGQNGKIDVNVSPGKSLFAYTVGSIWAACKVEGSTISYAFSRNSEVKSGNSSPSVYLIYGEY